MTTTVVNVKNGEKFDVYIGRECYGYSGSIFANPFKIGISGTRQEVIEKYKRYIRKRIDMEPGYRQKVLALKDKKLGCWCSPLPCHGDVLIEIIEEM